MRHTRIAKSRRHKKFKCVDNSSEDLIDRQVNQNNTRDQTISRKWQQILDLKQQMIQKNRNKKKKKKTNNELISIRTAKSDPIEKGMTRSAKQLPEVIEQGLYESQSHFISRLSKMSAKAKAEANIEDRFDVDFCQKLDTNDSKADEKTDKNKTPKNNKRKKQKVKQNERQNERQNEKQQKIGGKRRKEDSFAHLKDSFVFGERVAEPPVFDSIKFKPKLLKKQ
ncbi:unnamed protein product [Medioppia subpectinata]|uniref:Uncharacterized protein n=1 Tax=Medioppia subpectinata TaxID=1979941 RepID=A0A7R9LL13_9ACAR|nr:unnamed protein product [Medioppia subpectinata]CAG2119749.1 unnamed protein product [Medioppia subpectinata]